MVIETAAAVGIGGRLVEKVAPSFLTSLSNLTKKPLAKIKVQFSLTFERHLDASLKKAFNVKTLASKDRPILLSQIYVPLTLSLSDDEVVDDVILDPTESYGTRVIVSGTGGAGKTILMKHLLARASANQKGRIPLFFELRSFDFTKSSFLLEIFYNDLRDGGSEESRELFEAALEHGLFSIFLDGFDEIRPLWRERALKGIEVFARRYPKISMIISTRPKTGLHQLEDFYVYHIDPLNKDQAISVVNKTPFDAEAKEKFLTALKNGLYEKHQTLMSIPILVIMMLITFRTYSEIPDRMTVFYAQAFDTLYAIHDSENKLQFKREHHAGLAPDIFKKALEAFCYISLQNHDIEFTHNSLIDYIGKSSKIIQVDFSAQDFKDDLVQNVCILQPDGISFAFVHRSFQEYFASRFALNYSGDNQFMIMDKIVGDRGSSSAGLMMDEMDSAKFRRVWLIQKLKDLYDELKEAKSFRIDERLLKYFKSVHLDKNGIVGMEFGVGGVLYGKTEALQSFCQSSLLSASAVYNDLWVSKKNYADARKLAESSASGFVLYKDVDNPNEGRLYVNVEESSISWFTKTNIVSNLDNHLDKIKYELDNVRRYIGEQGKIESQLLGI